jgi:hypothetical protein
MFTTFEEWGIGLEDVEKKRGLCDFSMNALDSIRLQMEEIKPQGKKNKEIIIVRNGRAKHTSGKTTELF